jgi:hypothetical protein
MRHLAMRPAPKSFIHFSAWISILAFLAIEGDALLDQWQIGQASLRFRLGTGLVIAGACLLLFALLVAGQLLISVLADYKAGRLRSHRPQSNSPDGRQASASRLLPESAIIKRRPRDRSPRRSMRRLEDQTKRDTASSPSL